MGTVNSRQPIQSFQNEVSGPCSFPVSAFVSHQCSTSVLRGASSFGRFHNGRRPGFEQRSRCPLQPSPQPPSSREKSSLQRKLLLVEPCSLELCRTETTPDDTTDREIDSEIYIVY